MQLETIKKKAHALFDSASFLVHINSHGEYEEALAMMDALIDDYDDNRALIEVLSISIERWEDSADEFAAFNERIEKLETGEAVLKIIMQQYNLGVADFPEIGSKSLVSKIVNNKRKLTRDHIAALSKRFGISPSLFF